MWQSSDPVLGDYLNGQRNNGVYSSQNLGLYSYGLLNPLRVVDPDGRSGEDVLNVLEGYSSQTLEAGDKHPSVPSRSVADVLPEGAPIVTMGETFGALGATAVGAATGDAQLTQAGLEGLSERQQANTELAVTLMTMGRGSKAPTPKGLETRGYKPQPGERTIQGQVDTAVQQAGGNPTVQRGGQDLFRLRSQGHGSTGATATPQNVRNVTPDGRVFTGKGPDAPVTPRDIRELYKAQTEQGTSTLRTRSGR